MNGMKNYFQVITMENKKRLEIRLDPETSELIDTLIARTNLTKSSLIKNALKVYASSLKNGHIFTIQYKATKEQNITHEKKSHEEINEKDWDTLIEEIMNEKEFKN